MTSCFTLFRIFLPPFCSSCKISCSRNILRLHIHSTSSGFARKGCVAARNLFLHSTAPQHSTTHGRNSEWLSGPRGEANCLSERDASLFSTGSFCYTKEQDRLAQRSAPTDSWPNPEERTLRCFRGMAAAARGEYSCILLFADCCICCPGFFILLTTIE